MTRDYLSQEIEIVTRELEHELRSKAASMVRVAERLKAGDQHAANSLGEMVADSSTRRIDHLCIKLGFLKELAVRAK